MLLLYLTTQMKYSPHAWLSNTEVLSKHVLLVWFIYLTLEVSSFPPFGRSRRVTHTIIMTIYDACRKWRQTNERTNRRTESWILGVGLNSSNLRPVSRLGSSLTPASLLGRFSLFQWFLSPDIFWSSHKSTFCQGCVLLQGIRCPCPQSAPQCQRWPGDWIETCFVFKYFHHLTGWDNISPIFENLQTKDKVPEWNNDQGEEDQEVEVLLLLLPWRPALSCLEKPDQIYHMWGYTDNRPSYKSVIWLTFCVAKQPKRK